MGSIKNDIILFINHPKVLGIYGINLALNFKIICEVGCLVKVCRLIKKKSIIQLHYGFKIKELKHVSQHKQSYMNRKKLKYKLLFLYHSRSENGKSGIFSLFIQNE